MTSRTIKVAALAAVIAVGGYWYWSPFLTVRQMQSAAQQKDANAFNAHVDYPRLRESLKDQFSAMMGAQVGGSGAAESGFAALGALLGKTVVSPLVDAMVRPETVMRAMQHGELSPKAQAPDAPPDAPPSAQNPDSPAQAEPRRRQWSYERTGVDQLIAYSTDPGKPEAPHEEKFGLVFQRSGFADWKLTGFRLPAVNESLFK